MARVDEVGDGIYRISSTVSLGEGAFQFNQFLIDDERPTLIHTGMFPMFEDVRKAVAEVLDPASLAYVVCPHFEADECGGMGRFVEAAPEAVLACSDAGALLNLAQWDYAGPVQGYKDGESIDLGEHRLRFIETPHVHHWDSMMVFEETTGSLFSADLYMQWGDQPPIVRENLGNEMCQRYREVGMFAAEEPVLRVVDRLEKLDLQWIHPMHGGSLPKEVVPNYTRALREEEFAFEGKIFGRIIYPAEKGRLCYNRCGVSHTRICVARTQRIRSNNAEKISGGMAQILDLSVQERPELEAEIIEHHETTWGIRAHRPVAHGRGDTIR